MFKTFEMNKARRHELKMLKFKKRMKKFKLIHDSGNYFAYRSHATPCSCYMCSNAKYNRAKVRSSIDINSVVKQYTGQYEMDK